MTDRLDDLYPGLDWAPPKTEGGLAAANDNIRSLIRAGIYGRHSAESQIGTNGASSMQQVDLGRIYAESIGAYAAYERVDENMSGAAIENRPGLLELIELARQGAYTIIIMSDLSRYGRHAETCISSINELFALGIKVHIIGIGEVTKHVAASMLVAAEAQLDYLHAATRMALMARARRGHVTSRAPYGFAADPARRGAIVQVKKEIERLTWMIARVMERGTATGLAEELNSMGWLTRAGTGWSRSTLVGSVRNPGVLRNPFLTGLFISGKSTISRDSKTGRRIVTPSDPSKWVVAEVPGLERVLERGPFAVLQTQLDGKRRHPIRAPEAGTAGKEGAGEVQGERDLAPADLYLSKSRRGPNTILSAKVRCYRCGSNMSSRGGGKGKTYVVCTSHIRKMGCPEDTRIDRSAIEKLVLDRLREILEDPQEQAIVDDSYRIRRDERARLHVLKLKKAEDRLREIEAEIASVRDAVRRGTYLHEWEIEDQRELQNERIEMRISVKDAEIALASLRSEASPVERIRQGIGDLGELLSARGLSTPARAVIGAAVGKVTARPVGDQLLVRVEGLLSLEATIPRPGRGRPSLTRIA